MQRLLSLKSHPSQDLAVEFVGDAFLMADLAGAASSDGMVLAVLPATLLHHLVSFLPPAELASLAPTSRLVTPTVANAWSRASFGLDTTQWPNMQKLRTGKRSAEALPFAMLHAALYLLPKRCWEEKHDEELTAAMVEEDVLPPSVSLRSRPQRLAGATSRPFIAGSFALHIYHSLVLGKTPDWAPNDVDVWFPNRASVTRMAALYTQRLLRTLGLDSRRVIVKPQTARRLQSYLATEMASSVEGAGQNDMPTTTEQADRESWLRRIAYWLQAAIHYSQTSDRLRLPPAREPNYFQFGPHMPVTAEVLRNARCVVSQCVDVYVDIDPAPPTATQWCTRTLIPEHLRRWMQRPRSERRWLDLWTELLQSLTPQRRRVFKVSFIGVVPATPGMRFWWESERLPPITPQDVLQRFDISVCKVGLELRTLSGNLIWHFADKAEFETHVEKGIATQSIASTNSHRSAVRRAKYEARGFTVTVV